MKAPAHLARETKRWWLSVQEEFELGEHHVRLLTLACESWDRAKQAREALNGELVYTDRFGCPRVRPEVTVERDSRLAFVRILRELALDVEPPRDAGRPPGIGR